MPIILISSHKKIIYIFIILTIIVTSLTLFGLIQQSYGATIVIVSKPHNIKINFSETFDSQIIQEILSTEEIFTPKAVVSMEDFATGEVIIINNSAQNQVLVANTRLLSSENLLFRLTNRVIVPAHQRIRTTVRADKPGQEYEIGPTKFTIPGLSPILQTKIYAESKEPMTGGFKKTGIVTQKDLDEATTSLKEKLQKDALVNLEKKITDLDLKTALRSEVIEVRSDAKPNEEKNQFTMKMTLKVTAALIKEKELLKKTNEKLINQAPPGQKLATVDQSTFAYRLKSYDIDNKRATLEIHIDGQTILSENNELLSKRYFISKTENEIKQYLQNIDDIENFRIIFSPFFIKKTPKVENKIRIIIK